ncbi:hypothetical protein DO72_4988 [Burkholderia pseudomallei]|nr:hypothetical protein DO72_4988 [Burkholderia pseudomallei]
MSRATDSRMRWRCCKPTRQQARTRRARRYEAYRPPQYGRGGLARDAAMLVNDRVPIVLSPILQRCDCANARCGCGRPRETAATGAPVIARGGANVSNVEFKRRACAGAGLRVDMRAAVAAGMRRMPDDRVARALQRGRCSSTPPPLASPCRPPHAPSHAGCASRRRSSSRTSGSTRLPKYSTSSR